MSTPSPDGVDEMLAALDREEKILLAEYHSGRLNGNHVIKAAFERLRALRSARPAVDDGVRAATIEECAKIGDDFAAYEETVVDRASADQALSDTVRKSIISAATSRQVAAEQIAHDIRALSIPGETKP